MVQNVSFKYSDNTVSVVNNAAWTDSTHWRMDLFLSLTDVFMFPIATHI